jgi:hypothetical protein
MIHIVDLFECHVTVAYSWVLLIPGANPGFMGLEGYTVLGSSLTKRMQNYEYKLGIKVSNCLGSF